MEYIFIKYHFHNLYFIYFVYFICFVYFVYFHDRTDFRDVGTVQKMNFIDRIWIQQESIRNLKLLKVWGLRVIRSSPLEGRLRKRRGGQRLDSTNSCFQFCTLCSPRRGRWICRLRPPCRRGQRSKNLAEGSYFLFTLVGSAVFNRI